MICGTCISLKVCLKKLSKHTSTILVGNGFYPNTKDDIRQFIFTVYAQVLFILNSRRQHVLY